MHMIISFRDRRRVEAIVLAVSADRMRISLPNCEDAVELRQAQGVWTTEDGEPIEIESMIAGRGVSALVSSLSAVDQAAAGRAVV